MSKPKSLHTKPGCSKLKQSKCIASNGDPHKLQNKNLQKVWMMYARKYASNLSVSKTQPLTLKCYLGQIQ